MDRLIQDLRQAVRMTLRNPGFSAIAVLTLALGIGANTAIFSLLDALLLRPIDVESPQELVFAQLPSAGGGIAWNFSYPDYADLREGCRTLSGLAAYSPLPATFTAGGESIRLSGAQVSGNFFEVLGVRAARGRALLSEDDAPAAAPALVLGDRAWRSRFGADPDVVGRPVYLNDRPFTVVGVAPRNFQGPTRGFAPDFWIPLTHAAPLDLGSEALVARNLRWLFVIGRLRPGVGPAEAQDELAARAGSLPRQSVVPEADRETLVLAPAARGDDSRVGNASTVGMVLMGGVGAVLLIACANVGGLILARSFSRRREMAIRLAVGVGRGRLIRQLLAESAVLAAAGGIAGVLLALWLLEAFGGFHSAGSLPVDLALRLDLRVLGFAAAASGLAVFLFGLVPALEASRVEPAEFLKVETGAGMTLRRESRLRSALVVVQVALSLVLLVGAGLFFRSLRNQQRVDLGFEPRGRLALTLDLGKGRYDEPRAREFYRRLIEEAGALPGVESASLVSVLTPSAEGSRITLAASDLGLPGNDDVDLEYNSVGPGYFRTLGIPVIRGREFSPEDIDRAPGAAVAIVNETLARRLWDGANPIGRRLSLGGPAGPFLEVVGVARDGKYRSVTEQPRNCLYRPIRNHGEGERTLVLRSVGDPGNLVPPLRRIVQSLDSGVPVFGVRTMEEQVSRQLQPARLTTLLLVAFALLALGLAALGLYGLLAYTVARRTHEIGVRMALGARRDDVLRLVVRQGMRLVVAGMALGLAGAGLLARVVAGLLYGVAALDPLTFATLPLLLAGVTLLACYLPARRAAKLDPMGALRAE